MSGIPLALNFSPVINQPLDNRSVVDTLPARNAIPPVSRYEGMKVFVEDTGINYQLIGGILDGNWVNLNADIPLTAVTSLQAIDGDSTELLSWSPVLVHLAATQVVDVLGTQIANDAIDGARGATNGIASLVDGKVPVAELPSYVDEVVEVASLAVLQGTTIPKLVGTIYVTLDTNRVYRWTGTAHNVVEISGGGVAIGGTSSTAHRGDHGVIAYNHSQATGNPHGLTKAQISLGNVENLNTVGIFASPASNTRFDLEALFNGNRVITGDLGVKGDNLGGANVKEFLERVFFPAVSPNVTFNFSPTNPSEFGIDRTFTFVLGGNTNDGEVEGGIVSLNGTGTTLGTINPVGVNTAINQSFAYTHDGYPDDEGIRSEVELILNGDTSVIFPEATLTWVNPYFYGSIPTNDLGANHLDNNGADSIGGTDFTKALWTKSTRTISYSPSSERMIFAYPASYGNLTGIKDANGFDIMTLFIKHPTYIYTNAANEGVPYNFYYSASETTQTNFNITFEV